MTPADPTQVCGAFMLVFTVLALVNLGLLVFWLVSWSRTQKGLPPLMAPKWSVVDLVVAAQVALLLISAVVLLLVILPAFSAGVSEYTDAENLLTMITQYPLHFVAASILQGVILAYIAFAYIYGRYRLRFADIGLSRKGLVRGLAIGLALAIPIMLITHGIEWGSAQLTESLADSELVKEIERSQSEFSSEAMVKAMQTAVPFWLMAVFAVVAAPLSEEIFFRGFMYNVLRSRLGVMWGMIITSFVFSLIHMDLLNIIAYLWLSFLLVIVYERTRNLWVPIGIHVLNNLVATLALYYVT